MPALQFDQPPASLCILRLSAIGDVTHVLPVIATLQQHWPQTRITWIIGAAEYQLVKSLPNVEFIVFDKKNGFSEFLSVRQKLKRRRFDVLLMMQVALRASLVSLLVKADIRIGYDKKRTRDLQWLFCDQQIEGPDRVHVLDSFFQFIEKLGIQQRKMDWLLTADDEARRFAHDMIQQQPTVIINPCSSVRKNNWRNWPQDYYADVISILMEKGFRVILSGGPSTQEQQFASEIVKLCQQQPLNLVGQTSLMQLLALMEQAVALIAPDTGPAHMGTIAGIKVIGLYASSNPLRTGPYESLDSSVNAYPEALKKYASISVNQARWGQRVRHPDVMKMIRVEHVMQKIPEIIGENG